MQGGGGQCRNGRNPDYRDRVHGWNVRLMAQGKGGLRATEVMEGCVGLLCIRVFGVHRVWPV
jgi:hypothetical protein